MKKRVLFITTTILIIWISLILTISKLSLIYLLVAGPIVLFIRFILSRHEVKSLTILANDAIISTSFNKTIEYLENNKFNFYTKSGLNACLYYIVLLYMYNDQAKRAKIVIEENSFLTNYKNLYYINFIIAVANNDVKSISSYYQQLLNLKNKRYDEQKESAKKILKMYNSKIFDDSIFTTTKIPLVKKICSQYTENKIEIENLKLKLKNNGLKRLNKKQTAYAVTFNFLTCISLFIGIVLYNFIFKEVSYNVFIDLVYRFFNNTWTFAIFFPIALYNIYLGVSFKYNRYEYKSNLVLGIVFSIILSVFLTSFLVINTMFSKNKRNLYKVQEEINITFPNDFSIISFDLSNIEQNVDDEIYITRISFVKFKEQLPEYNKWTNSINYMDNLPYLFVEDTRYFNRFMIYCIDTNQYNTVFYEKPYHYIALGYDTDDNCLVIYEFHF